MIKYINKLYENSELYFSLVFIFIYCFVNSLANNISEKIGIESSVTFLFNIIFSVFLYIFIKRKNLLKYYGICRSNISADRFLWYIPLIIFTSNNLWLGFSFNISFIKASFYILNMLCVGFLEELIFKAFLFKALCKDNIKTAIMISSISFGIGHILNLFNGSGMQILDNICQIIGAIACGFLFVFIFYRGGSLIPCILAHSINNSLSIFSNEVAMTSKLQILFSTIIVIIVIFYIIILNKLLPQKNK